MRTAVFLWLVLAVFCLEAHPDRDLTAFKRSFRKKLEQGIPEWMKLQADRDLAPFRNRPVSKEEILQFYAKTPDSLLVRFTIKNNRLSIDTKCSKAAEPRLLNYREVLEDMLKTASLPDVVFFADARR